MVAAADNSVCSWGRGEDGQLGHGDAEERHTPTELCALDGLNVSSVSCGADHTTAYSVEKNVVWSWGWSVENAKLQEICRPSDFLWD